MCYTQGFHDIIGKNSKEAIVLSDFSYLFSCLAVNHTVILVFESFLDREISISSLSCEEIYPLLNDIDSDDDDEDINNLMNDSDTEFENKAAVENLEFDISEVVIHREDDSNVINFISTAKPIESVVRIAKPNSGVPLMMF